MIAQDDVVLIRVYGNKTDLLIDRKAETKNIQLLQKYGFAPSLYAIFLNGIAYEYVPGVTLTPTTVIKSNIWPLVATRMANMHKLKFENQPAQPEAVLLGKTQRFLDLVPERFIDSEKHMR